MSRRIDRVIEEEDAPETSEDTWSERPHRQVERHYVRSPTSRTLRKWMERVDDRFMGSPVDLDPTEAIMWAMRVSAGEVAYCDAQISRLSEDELFERPERVTKVFIDGSVDQLTEVRSAEQMSRWVRWRDQAMQRMATYAKMALDVGIEERQIRLAEEQAQQLVNVISAVLTDLGHDLKDVQTREIVRKRLMEGATIEGRVIAENGVPIGTNGA